MEQANSYINNEADWICRDDSFTPGSFKMEYSLYFLLLPSVLLPPPSAETGDNIHFDRNAPLKSVSEESEPLQLLQKLIYFAVKARAGNMFLLKAYFRSNESEVCSIQVARQSVCLSEIGSMISIQHVRSVFSLFPGEQHTQGEFYFAFLLCFWILGTC